MYLFQFLDLRNNRIARLDMETVKSIFVVKERRLQLSGNPLICDCENYDLIEALQLHKDQVNILLIYLRWNKELYIFQFREQVTFMFYSRLKFS